MTKKQIRYALNVVLNAAENVKCKDLHHPKKHQHPADELCKAEYHIHRQANLVRQFMKERGIS